MHRTVTKNYPVPTICWHWDLALGHTICSNCVSSKILSSSILAQVLSPTSLLTSSSTITARILRPYWSCQHTDPQASLIIHPSFSLSPAKTLRATFIITPLPARSALSELPFVGKCFQRVSTSISYSFPLWQRPQSTLASISQSSGAALSNTAKILRIANPVNTFLPSCKIEFKCSVRLKMFSSLGFWNFPGFSPLPLTRLPPSPSMTPDC